MPRPTNKATLLALSESNYNKLQSFISKLSAQEQEQDFPPGTLNRNIRDVLAHLHHWHLLFLDWYKVGMQGQKPAMPAKGYTWKTTATLNQKIQTTYQQQTLSDIQSLLNESYLRVRQHIEQHSDEELFEKKRYHWTGSTSLGAYLVSATSSHYNWALKLIKKARKKQAQV